MSSSIRRLAILALAALTLAATASPASAGRRLTGNGTGNQWNVFWSTPRFTSVSGLIDIWYRCRPRNNGVSLQLTLHRSDGREQIYKRPCDRQGRWIHNIVVSPTPHDVRAETFGGQAMGYTSVYEGH